jgi:hypothetical protein
MPEIVRFRSRILEIDDDCRARAAEDGVTPLEQRLWQAGFTRESAQRAAQEVEDAKQEPGPAPPDGSGRA